MNKKLTLSVRGHIHIHVAINNVESTSYEWVGGFIYKLIKVISWQFDN
jgi:hypothetical protein